MPNIVPVFDGSVLDILVRPRRDDAAARRFFGRVLKSAGYEPRVVITNQLASYTKPCAELLPNVEHRRNKALNNRAENSHQSTRERERRMRGFKSARHAQRFLSRFGMIVDLFRPAVIGWQPGATRKLWIAASANGEGSRERTLSGDGIHRVDVP